MNDPAKYNAWFRNSLSKHHPDLISVIEDREHQGLSYLRGSIVHDDPRRSIVISNYGGEITVAIDRHHVHFDHEAETTWDEDFAEAIEWIHDLITGQVFVCSKFDGDRFSSSLSTYSLNDVQLRRGERLEVICYPETGFREIHNDDD
jgi:hypothetical protein